MTRESQRLELSTAVARNRQAWRDALSEKPEPREPARPLEFDENGFPLPQPVPRFVQRVGRLLGDV